MATCSTYSADCVGNTTLLRYHSTVADSGPAAAVFERPPSGAASTNERPERPFTEMACHGLITRSSPTKTARPGHLGKICDLRKLRVRFARPNRVRGGRTMCLLSILSILISHALGPSAFYHA